MASRRSAVLAARSGPGTPRDEAGAQKSQIGTTSIPELAGLPIIAVTARTMQEGRDKSIAAGASDYITKSVDAETLLGRMEDWLATPGQA
jgi:CheY-like chemotaxis protein